VCATEEEIGKDPNRKLYDKQFKNHELGNCYDLLDRKYKPLKSPQNSLVRSKELGQSPKTVVFDYSHATPVTDKSVVICFDEASALPVDAIRALRRISKMKGIIIILADTAASIYNFMPYNDHSSSLHSGHLGRFIAPIFSLKTSEPTWSFEDDYEDCEDLFGCGRPLS